MNRRVNRRVKRRVKRKTGWEDGFITVNAAFLMSGLMVLLMAVAAMQTLYAQSVHLQAVSDVAALSAVQASPSALFSVDQHAQEILCARAQAVVEQNHKALAQCWRDQSDLRIIVQADATISGGWLTKVLPALNARTRAGY